MTRAARTLPLIAGLLLAGLLLPRPAQPAITLTANDPLSTYSGFFIVTGTHTRRLTMRVGSPQFGNVSNVTFNVTGANTSPSPTPVVGIPSAGAGVASAPANSVRISVSNRWTDFAGQQVIVTVNSAAGLVCASGPCGSTVIPFNKVSWTASNLAGGAFAGQDFVSGSFNGSTNQTLLDFTVPEPQNRSFNITNDWVFTYANDVLYPAGVYRGRVTFTATMP